VVTRKIVCMVGRKPMWRCSVRRSHHAIVRVCGRDGAIRIESGSPGAQVGIRLGVLRMERLCGAKVAVGGVGGQRQRAGL
jgi:hypothetical protein